jgi:ankyrin repeat protein
VDVNVENNEGETLLHLAASQGYKGIVELLINRGADIHARNQHDFVIHQAVSSNNLAIVDLLLGRGANINAVDNEGDTPLEWASEKNSDGLTMMRLLLERGADINQVNHEGNTALHLCAQNGQRAALELLLEQGANCQLVNHAGQEAADLARLAGHAEIVKMIELKFMVDSSIITAMSESFQKNEEDSELAAALAQAKPLSELQTVTLQSAVQGFFVRKRYVLLVQEHQRKVDKALIQQLEEENSNICPK